MKKNEATYQERIYMEHTQKMRQVLETMPDFVRTYFRAIEPTTTAKTRISYAYDVRLFLQFLQTEIRTFQGKRMGDFLVGDLDEVKPVDIEEFLEYLKLYQSPDGKTHKNGTRGLHRKLSTLRSFYRYYQKKQMIQTDPTVLVDMPKLRDKEIIRLDYDEVASLLDLVEFGGENYSGMKKIYHEKNKWRNLAIFTLLLGTGIRVSECVGLSLGDLDFKNNRIKVVRKGEKEDFVYFGEEVEAAIKGYLEKTRTHLSPAVGHEDALFLSIQKKRMSVQAVEDLVGEYAKQITAIKHITPHKLRSTYGTNLYRETGDIYLVAEVLGHNDVNTTRKHYAAMGEDKKRMAAKAVALRKDT